MEKLNNGKPLPLETRLEMYKELLDIYITGKYHRYLDEGLCFTAKPILMRYFGTIDPVYIDDQDHLLPELWDLRTVEYPCNENLKPLGWWYNSVKERKEALKKAIKLLSTKQ